MIAHPGHMTGYRKAIRFLGASLMLVLIGPVSAEPAPRQQWYQSIETGYRALADSAAALSQSADNYCDAPDPSGFETVRRHWRSALLTWQAVRFVDFGPVERDSRAWQIQFWPDPRNLVAHKARGWLKSTRDINRDAVATDGVAVQGLPLLEYLLFDDQLQHSSNALPAARTCALLSAVSAHLATTTAGIVADWRALAPTYRQDARYTTDTFNAVRTLLDTLQDKRLEATMGVRSGQQANPYLGDAWRSGQSLAAMRASLGGVQRYFLPGLSALMAETGQSDLFRRLQKQLRATLAAFQQLPDSLTVALDNESDYQALQSLLVQVSELRTLLAGPVADQLGMVRGFNASDGD
ncbi:MAG: imelysin family protein [Marinobacter sp.]|nr:imelysin family protein [Marinobacter sp.]